MALTGLGGLGSNCPVFALFDVLTINLKVKLSTWMIKLHSVCIYNSGTILRIISTIVQSLFYPNCFYFALYSTK